QDDEIRLITLQPGRGDEPLRCSLRPAPLANNTHYESLSYCWGPNKAEAVIRCDHGMLLVTRNSFAALKHLRERDRARTLWMDALCINQADTGERGHQVSLMRSIFQASGRTVVWLGD
ncbi:heterokaryon incompatibility protein-domain-containing protein, partial [Lophiotrema nucula]